MDRVILRRQQHWERRVVEWAESLRGQPYVWGQTDCASLALAAIGVITGCTREALGVPSYHTKFGAVKVMVEQRGSGSLIDAFRERGLVSVDARFLQSGDVIVREETDHVTPEITIVVASHVLVSRPDAGVTIEPLSATHYADVTTVLRVP